jgi:hypothetical protein
MNIKDVVATLILNLPNYTDIFTDFVNAQITASYVSTARKIKVETATAHGLLVGDSLIIKNAKLKNEIDSIEISGNYAVITLKAEHDFVLEDDLTFEMAGNSDDDWNGEFEIYNVPNKTTIEITKPSSIIPETLGYIWELRDYGGNGTVQIVAVNETHGENEEYPEFWFEYEINDNDPDLPVTDEESVSGIEIITGVRVTGVADPERAIDVFTKTNGVKKPWAFVMFPDETVSKDKNNESEAVGTFVNGDESRQLIMVNFDVCVIQPCTELGGIEEIEKACGEIRNALIKSLVGLKSTETEADKVYKTVYNGSSMNTYDTANYIRVYSFQTPFEITYRETAENRVLTVALRKAVFKLQTGGANSQKTEATINFEE